MRFFRYYAGVALAIYAVVFIFGCSSPLQKANNLAMSDPKAAITAYKEIIKAKPGTDEAKEAQLGLANTYYKQLGDKEKGLEVYQEIIKSYPNTKYSGEAHWALARHFFEAKDYEKARTHFAKVTQEMPGTERASDAALMIAKCYEELKKYNEAAKMYTDFAKDHPNHRRAAQAGIEAAKIYQNQGEKDKAVEAYKAVASKYALSSSGREARQSLTDMGVDISDLKEMTGTTEKAQAQVQPQTTMNRASRRRAKARNVPRPEISGLKSAKQPQKSRSVSKDFGVDPLDVMPVINVDSQGTMYDAMYMFANMSLQSHQYRDAGALYEKALELAGAKMITAATLEEAAQKAVELSRG